MVDGDDLAERAAGVVADQHDVVEVERLQEGGDDRRDAARREVGAGLIGSRWAPSGQVGMIARRPRAASFSPRTAHRSPPIR
jgi:hypothetical protein